MNLFCTTSSSVSTASARNALTFSHRKHGKNCTPNMELWSKSNTFIRCVKRAVGTTQLYKIVVVYKGMDMPVCEEVYELTVLLSASGHPDVFMPMRWHGLYISYRMYCTSLNRYSRSLPPSSSSTNRPSCSTRSNRARNLPSASS